MNRLIFPKDVNKQEGFLSVSEAADLGEAFIIVVFVLGQ